MSTIDPQSIPEPVSAIAVGVSRQTIIASYTLTALSTLVFIARIWTRTRPVFRMQLEDFCICFAYVNLTLSTTLWLAATYKVYENPLEHTAADSYRAGQFTYIGRWFWPWAMAGTKVGVGIMLLRFHREKFWRRLIYVILGIQISLTIYTMVLYSIECRPAIAYWDRSPQYKGKCLPIRMRLISVGTVAGVNIVTDLGLSLAPIPILMRVRRPLLERMAVGLLMAMGLTAAAASMTKTILTFKRRTGDSQFNQGQLRMWALIEEDLAFIAACIPTLKGPIHRLLAHLGLVSSIPGSSGPSWDPYDHGKGSSGIRTIGSASVKRSTRSYMDDSIRDVIKLKDFKRDTFNNSEEEILGLAEVRRAGEIWCTDEFHVDEERVGEVR